MKATFTLQNLNCANCAAKIENKIAQTEGFHNVSFNFATKQLRLSTDYSDALQRVQGICDSIEDGVTVVNADKKISDTSSSVEIIALIISAALTLSALTAEIFLDMGNALVFAAVIILFSAAALISGYRVFWKGIKSAARLRLDETTLLTIAVIAAFCLGEYFEGAMVTLLFSFGEFIEARAVNSSRKDIEKLANIRPDTATVIENGVEKTVSAESVKVGSTVLVKPYERIPLDGVVTIGSSSLDVSALTGESLPVDVSEGSEVLSGSINKSGLIELKTIKPFGESTATRILRLVEDAALQKGQSERLITRFAAIYTPIIIAISVIIAVVPPLIGLGSFSEWLYRALVCLVASCPCAIVISVPLSYYSGIGAASKNGVLIKGGKYLEALASADSFVFDKTGTLTSGQLEIKKITATSDMSTDEVLALAAACEKNSAHPIAHTIVKAAEQLELPKISDCSEQAGFGVKAVIGSKTVMCGGKRILSPKQLLSAPEDCSVFVLCDGVLVGAISIGDTVRKEAKSVIEKLKKLGIKNLVMLTGDSRKNAERVADELRLTDFRAELMPDDKPKYVKELKQTAKGACFVGDGINDAPVLSASDCGIAMGMGSEAAIEASDAVLVSGNLSQLPKAVAISRKVLSTVRLNIAFALAVKAAVIVLAAVGLAAMWMSVIADVGVSVLCVLYASRLLKS